MDNIHSSFQDQHVQKKLKEVLSREKMVQLQEFLYPPFAENLLQDISFLSFKDIFDPRQKKITSAESSPKIKSTLEPCTLFLERFFNKKIKSFTILVAEKGSYTVMTDFQKPEQGYDAVLDLTQEWNPSWGGLLYYSSKKEKKAVPCGYKSITLIKKENTKKYLKYINHYAKRKRIFILFSV